MTTINCVNGASDIKIGNLGWDLFFFFGYVPDDNSLDLLRSRLDSRDPAHASIQVAIRFPRKHFWHCLHKNFI